MVHSAKDGAGGLLRVGVVGVGVMGSNHARVLADLAGVKLVGIADPDRKQRDFVSEALGCAGHADVEALIAGGVDAVTIAAPTHLHRDLALTCIRHGVHVLVEKPIASSVEEGHAIIAAAQRAGVTLMVGHVERFNPAVEAIKEAIRDEDILSIAITRVGPFPPRMSNVGVVIDLAVHDIDLIRWFTDSEIVEVQPQLSSAIAEREDIALLQFRTASGVLAHINTNWLTPFKARNVTVATRKKYVMGDLLTRQVTECFGFQPDGSYSMRHLSVGHAEPLRAELQAFVSAIRSGERPAVTGEEGVASLEIAIRCLESTPVPSAARGAPRPRRADRLSLRPATADHVTTMNQHARLDPAPIPFIDVAAQRRRLGRAIDDAIARVLGHCQFIMGPEVRALEADLAAFCGARHAITCASGTDALAARPDGEGDRARRRRDLSDLHLLRDRRGGGAGWRDAGVRRRRGRRASISIRKAVERARRDGAQGRASAPKAVIPVDLFGQPADHDAIAAIARGREPVRARRCRAGLRRDLPATGASARSRTRPRRASFRPSRSAATATAARSSPTTTSLPRSMRSLRVHGEGRDEYDCVRIGINGRFDTIQAAVLIEKLKIFPDEIAARDRIARRYSARARRRGAGSARGRGLDLGVGAVHDPPAARAGATASPPRSRRRASRPRSIIRSRCIARRPIGSFPVAEGGLPVSERLADEVISLPMHAYLDEPTQDRIIAAVRQALAG